MLEEQIEKKMTIDANAIQAYAKKMSADQNTTDPTLKKTIFLSTQPYKGTRDFYPEAQRTQDHIFSVWSQTVEAFGYEKYNGPMLESFDIYAAKSGQELVEKQLYSLLDQGDRRMAVRPEMTPTMARMVAAKINELPRPIRWYSIPNLWRYERPQKGRLREHWQLNVDLLGGDSEKANCEILELAWKIFDSVGGGEHVCIRINHRKLVDEFFKQKLPCSDATQHSLIKLIDAKDKMTSDVFEENLTKLGINKESAAALEEFLKSDLQWCQKNLPSAACEELSRTLERLHDINPKAFVFDPSIMRGLDYYTGIVFEGFDISPENPRAMFGGGRYDQLIALFGKQQLSGVGFGMGDVIMESFLRTHNLLPNDNSHQIDFYFAIDDSNYTDEIKKLCRDLRNEKMKVVNSIHHQDLKQELKVADKLKAQYVIFTSNNFGMCILKNLQSGEQHEMHATNILEFAKKNLSKT